MSAVRCNYDKQNISLSKHHRSSDGLMMLLSAPHTCHSLSLYPDDISTRLYATLQNRSLNVTCPNSTPVSATLKNTSFYSLICIPIRAVRLLHTTGTAGQIVHCITRKGTSRAAHVSEGILSNNIRPKINPIIILSLMVKFLNVLTL